MAQPVSGYLGRVMVLTTTGRRSGLKRRTPVNYARLDDGHVGCVAGFGPQTDWYRNLQAHPTVEVWLPDGWVARRSSLAMMPPGYHACVRS